MSSVAITPIQGDLFDADDEDGWQDMPVVREDEFASGLDEEDQKKYHYVPSAKGASATNATGSLIDLDGLGHGWRSKVVQNESEYTRLRVNEEDEADEVHLRTKYLFDEDKAMTPLSQMQATKNLLTEAQRIAYVGLCALTSREMSQSLKSVRRKELKPAIQNMELWAMKIMGRLYYHMELETQEQKMIESLAQHGVQASDLVPSLMTTHTVANPEYDPAEMRRQAELSAAVHSDESDTETTVERQSTLPPSGSSPDSKKHDQNVFQTTAKVLGQTSTAAMPGVTTSLSAADESVTLDIRWTILCDLFLVLIADSVYDARSRVLLENVALKLGLGWLDVVRFESRVTEALEIQEDVEKMENQELIDGRQRAARKKRYMMLGLATLGGGLVIGLSAGLLAPVIGAGLGAAFTTIGITGTTGFLAGAGGAAVITTGGVLTGSGIAVRGMAKRTRQVRTFDILPLHNNKRVNCILTVPGFMNGIQDDVRLPFSVLDPIVGDVFSVLWEPEMIQEAGSALTILTGEVLTQIGQTVLQATVMTALMTALQWPIILTKLGYLIDNPWNNALDRAKAAGSVLAGVLMERHLGVRPITLIGFSLGARVIFYALLELAKNKAFGIVQDVFLLGTTVTAPTRLWCETRAVVSGRYVNAFAKNDWVLNYLFRATSGGLNTVAGLRPINDVPGLENVDVTDKIAGHMSYRTFMPLILDQLGFPVSADYFDEPEEPDFKEDRVVIKEEDQPKKKGWFSRSKKSSTPTNVSRPPAASSSPSSRAPRSSEDSTVDGDLPPRTNENTPDPTLGETLEVNQSIPNLPLRAGFDFDAIKEVLGKAELNPAELQVPQPNRFPPPHIPPPTKRSESTPRPVLDELPSPPLHLSRSSLDSPYLDTPTTARPSSQTDLSSSFSHSVSLTDSEDLTSFPTVLTPRPLPSPALHFVGNTPWSPGTAEAFSSMPPAEVPSNTTELSPTFGSYQSANHNPFSTFSSSTISFGGTDGSVTSYPWDTRTELASDKKSTGFNTNPWT